MELIEFITLERKKQGYSRKAFSEKLFMSESNYTNIERGLVRMTLENYLLICDALTISPTMLVKNSNTFLITNHELEVLKSAAKIINNLDSQNTQKNSNITIGDNNSNVFIGNGNIEIK